MKDFNRRLEPPKVGITRGARALVLTTCALLALAISGPAMDIIDPYVHHIPKFMTYVLAPLAMLNFLDYLFGKPACAFLAVCVLLVLVTKGVKWWIKIALTLSAAFAWHVTPPWVDKVKHMW